MFKLMLKDLKYYIISYLLIYPLITLYWLTKADNSAFILIVFVQVMLMGALIVLPPLFAEQDEDANNGYIVLQTLPLTKKEIIGAKYLLPVMNAIILFVSNIFIFSFFNTDEGVLKIVNSVQILTIFICLFIVGIIYNIIAKIGYTNFLKYSSAGTVVLAFGSVSILSLFKVGVNELSQIFMKHMNEMNNIIALIVGLILYSFLYILSTKLERKT